MRSLIALIMMATMTHAQQPPGEAAATPPARVGATQPPSTARLKPACRTRCITPPVPQSRGPKPNGKPVLPRSVQPPVASPGAGQPRSVVRIVGLERTKAEQIAPLLKELGVQSEVVADIPRNRLVIRGTTAEVNDIATLACKLDARETVDRESSRGVSILRLHHRIASSVESCVRLVLEDQGDIAVDHARNAIVVRASRSGRQEVRDVVAALDTPRRSLLASFILLGRGTRAMPESPYYAKVRTRLDALGLRGYGVVSRTAVRTLSDAAFSAVAALPESGGSLRIEGTASEPGEDRQIELRLTVTQSGATIGTTLRAPAQDLVVVGFAPCDGEPIALAVSIEALPR